MSEETDAIWRQIEMLRAKDAEQSAEIAVLEERVANTIATWDASSRQRDEVLQSILAEMKLLVAAQEQRTGMEKLGKGIIAVVGIFATLIALYFAYQELESNKDESRNRSANHSSLRPSVQVWLSYVPGYAWLNSQIVSAARDLWS